jgi:hypothetical protein
MEIARHKSHNDAASVIVFMSLKKALLLWRFHLIVMVISGTDGSNKMKKRRDI